MGIFNKKTIRAAAKVIAPEIQVMMLGARRTGKTSMLASMYDSFSSIVAGTNLVISKKGGAAIEDSLDHMKALFWEEHMLNEKVLNGLDFTQTQGFDKIDFLLTIGGKKTVKPKVIRFVDCSGEWINTRANEEEVGEEIEKSEVVIIAIDTVLLMEENGKYNKLNAVPQVTEFIKNRMNPDTLLNDKKMVMFVPMKCEKYFHQNNEKGSIFYQKRMQDLAEKIQEEYAALLDFLTCPNNKKHFTVGIFPVITLGGIEFDEFKMDNKDNRTDILTDAIQYRYCEPDRYEPQFCDRPLIYALLFVQKKIADDYYSRVFDDANKGKRKVSAKIVEWFQDKRNIAKDVDYIHELDQVVEKLKTDVYPGFKMIQDPGAIEMKAEILKKG